MKKLIILGMVLLAIAFLAGCPDGTGSTDVVDDPPVVIDDPVPPSFDETIAGKFWRVDGIDRFQSTRSAVAPYDKGVCMYFGEDGMITFWFDANDDGLLSPSEEIGTPVPWEAVDGVLTINGVVWGLNSYDADGWSILKFIDGTTDPTWIGDVGDDYVGWLEVFYSPCLLMWDGPELTASFAFVFDDMGDVVADWTRYCKRFWALDVDFDWADGFYFTSGTPLDSYIADDPIVGNHIMIIDYHDGYGDDIDSLILIASEEYGFMSFPHVAGLKPDHVYDMTIAVDSADVGTFTFLSRVDGSGFTVDVVLDKSSMGELIIRGVDDTDVPVVNPTL